MTTSQTSSVTAAISRHRGTANPSSINRSRTTAAYSNLNENNLALQTYIESLKLNTFPLLSEEDQQERLAKIDALELFQALQDVNRDLAMTRLENYYLKDFLEKNDPKLLIGLQQQRALAENLTKERPKDVDQSVSSPTRRKIMVTTSRSQFTSITGGSQKKAVHNYKLNFKAKADMAEKTASEVENRVKELKSKASHEIEMLRGHLEEIKFMCEETQETIHNFQLHFLRDDNDLEFLSTATEKQLENKIKKFLNNWIKNGTALLATMRLKKTSLQDKCKKLQSELITKAELSGKLTSVDFEKLLIKRTELLSLLDEKNIHMAGLKCETGKLSLGMSQQKKLLMINEMESKHMYSKIVDVLKAIGKLEKEVNTIEMENQKNAKALEILQSQLQRFQAPSVSDYIEKKTDIFSLEKEEKILGRKISILTLKLDNIQKKCKNP